MSNRLLVWFGLISYPLYLWHWPLLSFTRIIQSETPSRWTRTVAVGISILLAWLTYKFIEKPFRFGKISWKKTILLIFLMCSVGFLGVYSYKQEGLPFRTVVKINPHKATSWGGGIAKAFITNECGITDKEDKKIIANCIQDARQTPRYALLGDSKAAALYTGLFRTSNEDGRWVFIGGATQYSAPVPVISASPIYKQYQKPVRIALDAILNNKNIETVVLVTATRALFRLKSDHSIEDLPASKQYNAVLEGLSNVTDILIKAGKKVVLVVDNPTFPDPKDCLNRTTAISFLNTLLATEPNEQCQITIKRHLELSKQYRNLLREVAAAHPDHITIFDTMEYLCEREIGLCRSIKNGRRLYSYSDHISDYAAGLIGKELNMFLRNKSAEKEASR
ncbi:MAG: acyltransferase [Candidatus Electrothrix sp. AR4]|nr:acyltransferase [Candidatus Electrothrix sp. AR4]